MCAKLVPTFDESGPREDEKRFLGDLRNYIEESWAELAEFAAARFKDVSVDSAHPGYLIRDKVLFPFYLHQDIPGTTELAEFVTLGLSLRVTRDGVICLSGSAVLLGALKFVGDIDYCEYAVPGTYSTADVVDAAGSHAVRTSCPLCERVNVMNPKWSQSCVVWDSTTSAELTRHLDEYNAHQLKLDFITSTQAVGTVEATNVVLLLAAGKEDEIARASFAAQEVPILGAVLPRPLCEPLQLGRYILFLIRQVQHFMSEDPAKALKRALSLARILMLSEWDEILIDHLNDPRAALTAAMKARSQLLEKLRGVTKADSPRAQTLVALQRSIESTIAELKSVKTASFETYPVSQAAADLWAGTVTFALSSFIRDAQEAIAGD